MPSEMPFVNPKTATLDTDQILHETIPVAKLIGLFVAIALVPLLFVLLVGGAGGPGFLFVLLAQFVLAVGTAITLMYVIARARTLVESESDDTPDENQDRGSDEREARDG